ncbi:hypothetical protein Tco_0328526 [Tanacetum coccineum]
MGGGGYTTGFGPPEDGSLVFLCEFLLKAWTLPGIFFVLGVEQKYWGPKIRLSVGELVSYEYCFEPIHAADTSGGLSLASERRRESVTVDRTLCLHVHYGIYDFSHIVSSEEFIRGRGSKADLRPLMSRGRVTYDLWRRDDVHVASMSDQSLKCPLVDERECRASARTYMNSEDAKRWYIPRWNITNDSLLDDDFSCRTLVDRVASPPGFFSALRNMDYDQLFEEFNVGAARQICLGSEVRSRTEHELELKEKLRVKYDARGVLLGEKDAEIARLKSLVKEKETESAEVLRLRDQVSVLAADKSLLSAEVSALKSTVLQKDTDISLLDSRASYLKSALDDSQAACDEARNLISSLSSERDGLASEVSTLHSAFSDFKEKMEAQQEEQAQELYNRVAELEAHVMDVSGRLEGEFYPAYLTALAGRRWLLTHGMELAMVKCLKSPEYQGILGHALGRAVDYGMQEGLAAGHEHGIAGTPLSAVVAYNPETAKNNYLDAVRALEEVDFPLVHLLKSKKDSGMDEVLDCFLLDGPLANLPEAAHLQPCLEQLSVPIYHADVNAVAGETSLSFALLNVHTRAEGAKKHAAALRQLMVDIVSHPLSSQNLLGQASTSVVISCVEDLDTDEDLGSVVCMPQFEDPRFEILP